MDAPPSRTTTHHRSGAPTTPRREDIPHADNLTQCGSKRKGRTLWRQGRAVLERQLAKECDRTTNDITHTAQLLKRVQDSIHWTTTTKLHLEIPPEQIENWTTLIRERWTATDPIARFYWEMQGNHNPWITNQKGEQLDHKYGNLPINRLLHVRRTSTGSFTIKWQGPPARSNLSRQEIGEYISIIIINARGYTPHETYPSNTAIRILNDTDSRIWTQINHDTLTDGKTTVVLQSLNSSLQLPHSGAQHTYVNFETHPTTTRGFGPEDTNYQYSTKHHHHRRSQKMWRQWKRRLKQPPKGLDRIRTKEEKQQCKQPEWAQPLQDITWKHIWKNKHSEARERTEEYFWKHQAYNVYTSQGIPQCTKCHQPETLQHIMWDCHIAQAVWTLLIEIWGFQTPEQATPQLFKHSIISNIPPRTSSDLHRD